LKKARNRAIHGLPRRGQIERVLQAVDLRRQLAQARPDAFLPALAMSLAVLAQITEDPAQSIAIFDEAINHLRPIFLQLPQAHRSLMGYLCQVYVSLCQTHSTEPDLALLAPITEKLQQA